MDISALTKTQLQGMQVKLSTSSVHVALHTIYVIVRIDKSDIIKTDGNMSCGKMQSGD